MRYRFDQIEAFLHVLEAGSISRAADRLGLAKSIISKRIADLERSLGVELIRRSARGIVPTERGRLFYSTAQASLQRIDDTIEEMSDRGALSGQMRITLPMSCGAIFLTQALLDFARRHPKLALALDFDDTILDLVQGGYDLAVRITQLKDSNLVARRLAVSQRVVCCSPSFAAQHGMPQSLDELPVFPCIANARSHAWEFESRNGAPKSVPVHSRIATNNLEAMRDAAIAGLGIAIVPTFVAHDALQRGALIPVLPSFRPIPDGIYAMYPRPHMPSRKTAALVEFLSDALRSRNDLGATPQRAAT